MTDDIVTVMCTTSGREEAAAIAHALVEERLAACVQLLPVESWYRWKGGVHRDAEVMLLAKTARDRLDALEERVKELHSYEVPEIVAVSVVGGSADYAEWVLASTAPSQN